MVFWQGTMHAITEGGTLGPPSVSQGTLRQRGLSLSLSPTLQEAGTFKHEDYVNIFGAVFRGRSCGVLGGAIHVIANETQLTLLQGCICI